MEAKSWLEIKINLIIIDLLEGPFRNIYSVFNYDSRWLMELKKSVIKWLYFTSQWDKNTESLLIPLRAH